jgi:glycosyltransferase involved in cell wall biosynthesis
VNARQQSLDEPAALVSIILPIYNAGPLLSAQIDSILAQTYPSWELLLVDDGSTDGSLTIARDYAMSHPAVRFLQNESNLGVMETVNRAVLQTAGDFVALSDHDDEWVPDKISRQVAYLESHPEVACVFSNRTIIDREGLELCASEYERIGVPPEVADTAYLLASMARYTHANTLLLRRQMPQRSDGSGRSGILDAIFPIARGWDWWIAAVSSWFGGVGFMRDALVRYRVYEGSISKNQLLYLRNLPGHRNSRTVLMRAEVRENTLRMYRDVISLRERAVEIAAARSEIGPPLALIENWQRWYGVLGEVLTQPTLQACRKIWTRWRKIRGDTIPGGWRRLLKAVLYGLPPVHRAYLFFATQLRGY